MNMLKIVSVGLISLALTATAFDADARRLGSGKNSGKQQSTMQRDSTPAPAAAPSSPAAAAKPAAAAAAPAAAAASSRSKWLGPIAGIAAGLGLAALASHLGFGAAFGNIMLMMLVGLVVLGAVGWFMARRRAKGGMASSMGNNGQFAGAAPGGYSAPNADSIPESTTQRTSLGNSGGGFSGIGSGSGSGSQTNFDAAAPVAVPELPAGFEIDSFLRNAKVYFLRLQAANDAGNVADIREFTTPEMFAELSLDIQDRKGAKQHTEVNSVDTQFMGIETQGAQYVAGVKYTGLISEDGAAPTSFKEAWVLVKPVDGSSGWLLAGIEQVQ